MAQSKEVHKEYMRRRREGSQEGSQGEGSQEGSQVRYDHDYTAREIQTLASLRTQDQVDRFPNIPLPFGEAYYRSMKDD